MPTLVLRQAAKKEVHTPNSGDVFRMNICTTFERCASYELWRYKPARTQSPKILAKKNKTQVELLLKTIKI